MAADSNIEWTDSTFNPWRGCTRVSRGCENCYAESYSGRNPRVLGVWGPQGTRVLAERRQWQMPWIWCRRRHPEGRRRRVFCASLADVFEDWRGQMTDSQERPLFWQEPNDAVAFGSVPYTLEHARRRLWDTIHDTPELDWLLLTKRPENIPEMMPLGDWQNVWLGVSVEDQATAWRLDALLWARQRVRCPVGFVSVEPLLGAVDLRSRLAAVEWAIVGGESGAHARPMNVEWAQAVVAQCREKGVACFVKQMGRRPRQGALALPLVHDAYKGGDPRDWPESLRVREFPAAGRAP